MANFNGKYTIDEIIDALYPGHAPLTFTEVGLDSPNEDWAFPSFNATVIGVDLDPGHAECSYDHVVVKATVAEGPRLGSKISIRFRPIQQTGWAWLAD